MDVKIPCTEIGIFLAAALVLYIVFESSQIENFSSGELIQQRLDMHLSLIHI